MVTLLRDLTPDRRKSRYGDIGYDFDHGVDTTWANVSFRTRIRELLSDGQYQPSEPGLFHDILNAMAVPFDGFTFIDLGSGKGRTLLMAADYPFEAIIGVELLPELHQVASKNIVNYRADSQRCFDIQSFAADARDFDFPKKPTMLYLFNPFPEHVFRDVLANLHSSVQAVPREVYVIYHNQVHEGLFTNQAWLEQLTRTHQYGVYRAVGDAFPAK
jgi:SAM-dependent methyltransferase